MEDALTSESAASEFLHAKQVYFTAAICLLLGLGIGYALRGVKGSPPHLVPAVASASAAKRIPGLQEMKQMADTKAAPLLAKYGASTPS